MEKLEDAKSPKQKKQKKTLKREQDAGGKEWVENDEGIKKMEKQEEIGRIHVGRWIDRGTEVKRKATNQQSNS